MKIDGRGAFAKQACSFVKSHIEIAPRETLDVGADTLKKSATLIVDVPDTSLKSGYVYIPGTSVFKVLTPSEISAGAAVLDSVPAGAALSIDVKGAGADTSTVFRDTVDVPAADTVFAHRPAVLSVSSAAELQSKTNALKPGDTMIVAAGTYALSTWIFTVHGTAQRWIVVRAGGKVIIQGNTVDADVVDLYNVNYLKLSGFEITGGSSGIWVDGTMVSNVVFDSLTIQNIPGEGVYFKADTVHDFTITNCEIAYAGIHGFSAGDGTAGPRYNVEVSHCYIHNCPTDSSQLIAYGISWEGKGYRGTFRDNVLHDIGGTAGSAILIGWGKTALQGDSPADRSVVSGNCLWNCPGEGITVMSDALVENNIVFDAGFGVHVQSDHRSGLSYIENLTIRNNTVFRCPQACLLLNDLAGNSSNDTISGNVFYQADTALSAATGAVSSSITSAENYYWGTVQGDTGFIRGNGLGDFSAVSPAAAVGQIDFYPSSTSAFVNVVPASMLPAVADFNGAARPIGAAADAGAYEYQQSAINNPGWKLAAGFKGR
jgi:hypothetical protein